MLDPKRRARVEAEAKRRGVSPAAAVAEAERVDAAKPSAAPDVEPAKDAAPARPIADRLLIGFLPFIKVRELRSLWLGLPDEIPDDELTCSEFAIKHGGPVAPTPAEPTSAEPAP